VAKENGKIEEKRRALSTRERGQQKHQQPGLSQFYECQNFFLWGVLKIGISNLL
jgi:hypothetical protein